MYKKNNFLKNKNDFFIIVFGIIIFSNELNYFRFEIFDNILFGPRILMSLFILYVFFSLPEKKLKNIILIKKNLKYFLIFFIYIFINLILFNDYYFKSEFFFKFSKILIYDLIKYSFLYIFFCIIGLNLINKDNLKLLFKVILILSYLSIVIGLFFIVFYAITEYELIKRLFYYDDFSIVGLRFYSFFGEPRNASVTLLSLVCLIVVIFKNLSADLKKQLWPWIYILIILSLISFFLTKSFTGLLTLIIGSLLSIIFISVNVFKKASFKKIIILILCIIVILALVYIVLFNVGRYYEYLVEFLRIFKILINTGIENTIADLTTTLRQHTRLYSQLKDVLPLLSYCSYFLELDILRILFGNGSYTSYYVESVSTFHNTSDFVAPHSFISRILYDNGMIGILILSTFVFSSLKKDSDLADKISLSFCFAGFLALNSTFLFILLMFNLYFKKTAYENKNKS